MQVRSDLVDFVLTMILLNELLTLKIDASAFQIFGLVDTNVYLEARTLSNGIFTYLREACRFIARLMSFVVRVRDNAALT